MYMLVNTCVAVVSVIDTKNVTSIKLSITIEISQFICVSACLYIQILRS